jgi:hypothetical protein
VKSYCTCPHQDMNEPHDLSCPAFERIVAAAIRWMGTTFSIPPPARHHSICIAMSEMGLPRDSHHSDNQGFITSRGRWVSREEAVKIATSAGQILKKTGPDYMLFSEDVW